MGDAGCRELVFIVLAAILRLSTHKTQDSSDQKAFQKLLKFSREIICLPTLAKPRGREKTEISKVGHAFTEEPGEPREAPPRPVACGTRQPRPPLSSSCKAACSHVRKLSWVMEGAASRLRGASGASLPPRVAEVTRGTPARERLNRFPGCFQAAAGEVLRRWPRPRAMAAGAEGTRGVGVAAKCSRGRAVGCSLQYGSDGRQQSRRPLGGLAGPCTGLTAREGVGAQGARTAGLQPRRVCGVPRCCVSASQLLGAA
ncbi:uncharacterized protein LOC142839824 [Microtus pennsylvanicus]|uniref:uncharacterized protein LOC142839824 n=1 Tax=Microtus pennsylvanicus TaxID=10058 RepID=UPI003F6D1FBC